MAFPVSLKTMAPLPTASADAAPMKVESEQGHAHSLPPVDDVSGGWPKWLQDLSVKVQQPVLSVSQQLPLSPFSFTQQFCGSERCPFVRRFRGSSSRVIVWRIGAGMTDFAILRFAMYWLTASLPSFIWACIPWLFRRSGLADGICFQGLNFLPHTFHMKSKPFTWKRRNDARWHLDYTWGHNSWGHDRNLNI